MTVWYNQTAGVVAFPAEGKLTADQLKILQTTPLVLSVTQPPLKHPNTKSTGTLDAAISEWTDGTYIRADKFVFRMNPAAGEANHKISVHIFATQFGLPLKGRAVAAAWAPGMLQANLLVARDLGHAVSASTSSLAVTAFLDESVGGGGKSAALAKLRR